MENRRMNPDVPLSELATRVEQPSAFRALEEDTEHTKRFVRRKAPVLTLRDARLSPHLSASLSYAFRSALLVRTARSWRTAFFVLLLFGTLPLLFAFLNVALGAKVQPLLIEKDKHGYVVVLGPAKAMKMDDPVAVMAALHDWTVAARSVVLDRHATQKNVQKVWHMVSEGTLAHAKVESWFNDARLYGNARRSIDVEDVHVEPIRESERVWKIEWTEAAYEGTHGMPARSRFSAVTTIDFARSDLERFIQLNPAGVFITDISITHHH
jgi:type IV secretory pathway TrbF-like protein